MKYIPKIEFEFNFDKQLYFFFSFVLDYKNNNHPFALVQGKEIELSIDIYYTSFAIILFWEQNA